MLVLFQKDYTRAEANLRSHPVWRAFAWFNIIKFCCLGR